MSIALVDCPINIAGLRMTCISNLATAEIMGYWTFLLCCMYVCVPKIVKDVGTYVVVQLYWDTFNVSYLNTEW